MMILLKPSSCCHPEPIRSSPNRPEQSEGVHGKLREGSQKCNREILRYAQNDTVEGFVNNLI